MWNRRLLSGEWHGRFEFADQRFRAADDGFTWTLRVGFFGGLRGESVAESSGEPASIEGSITTSGEIRIVMIHAADPAVRRMIDENGRVVTVAEAFGDRQWAEHVDSIRRTRGYSKAHEPPKTVAQLAADFAAACQRVEYRGRVVSRRRLEGEWRLPASEIPWAMLENEETKGTWVAER